MKEFITTFFEEHRAALVDLSFNLGYALFSAAFIFLILFFLLCYLKKHQDQSARKLKGYTKDSLLTFLSIIEITIMSYLSYVMGVKDGRNEELAYVFDVMPVWVYSLFFLPLLLFIFFFAEILCDKLKGTRIENVFTDIFFRFLKVGDSHDVLENPDIPDISDSNSSGGASDSSVHRD